MDSVLLDPCSGSDRSANTHNGRMRWNLSEQREVENRDLKPGSIFMVQLLKEFDSRDSQLAGAHNWKRLERPLRSGCRLHQLRG